MYNYLDSLQYIDGFLRYFYIGGDKVTENIQIFMSLRLMKSNAFLAAAP